MTAHSWAARAAGAALLLGTIAGGVAAVYVLYVEVRVATAIDEAAAMAQLDARYHHSLTLRAFGTIARAGNPPRVITA